MIQYMFLMNLMVTFDYPCANMFSDETYCHVGSTSSVSRFRNGVNELTRNSKITKFDVASTIEKDVAWFDISMNYVQFVLEVVERSYRLKRKISRYIP